MTDTNFPVLNFKDFISADGDRLTTDSRKVAAVHGKRHDNVVALIRKRIAESGGFGLLNFKESSYINEQSKAQPMFHMTKNGYAFLVGKMTGKKAVQFQIAYINAFDSLPPAMAERIGQMIESVITSQINHGLLATRTTTETLLPANSLSNGPCHCFTNPASTS